jgi:hypothetical protein
MRVSMLPLLLVGCANPISNALFIEDAEFLAAIPSLDRHGIDYPYALQGDEDDGDLRAHGAAVAANLELGLSELMTLTEYLRGDEPSVREDDLRSWGPSSLSNGSRSLLLVDIIRSGVGQYDWQFQLGDSSAGPWAPFFEGTHYSGATVADGDGSFQADLGRLSDALDAEREGLVRVSYDLREGTWLLVELEGFRELASERALDARYGYELSGKGAGDFQYGVESDIIEGQQLERYGLRVRWKSSGEMRADARIERGDMLGATYTLSQCWDASSAMVYQEDNLDSVELLGSESDCAFGKPLYVEDW